MHTYYLETNTGWGISPAVFITYFGFYAAGWMVYRTDSLELLKRYSLWQLAAGLVLFLIFALIPWPGGRLALNIRQAFAAIYSILLIFGIIAVFLCRFNFYSKRLTYIMDASYWVYIVHLPIIAFIPGLMANISMPALVKFLITLLGTALICFASYKYLVRNSFIGAFLNGKTHKQRKEADAEKTVALRA
jgi:glucan biosynthesis protein C